MSTSGTSQGIERHTPVSKVERFFEFACTPDHTGHHKGGTDLISLSRALEFEPLELDHQFFRSIVASKCETQLEALGKQLSVSRVVR